jgi:hypothetical protein
MLSYRRSYSVIWYIVNKLGLELSDVNNAMSLVKWTKKVRPSDFQLKEPEIIIPLKTLGYDLEGNLAIEYIENVGEQPRECSGQINVGCTEAFRILTSSKLKMTAPVTFYCRTSFIVLNYTTQFSDTTPAQPPQVVATLVEDNDTPTGNVPTPPIDEIKKIIMNKINSQLTITIPKDSGYSVGEYIEVFPVPEQDVEKLRGNKQ